MKYGYYALVAFGVLVLSVGILSRCVPKEEREYFFEDLFNGDLFSSTLFSKNGMPKCLEEQALEMVKKLIYRHGVSPDSVAISQFKEVSRIGPGKWTAAVDIFYQPKIGQVKRTTWVPFHVQVETRLMDNGGKKPIISVVPTDEEETRRLVKDVIVPLQPEDWQGPKE